MNHKRIIRIALVTGLILLVPLVLTLLNISSGGIEGQGWYWRPGDFIVMGVLLFGAGLALDVAARKLTSPLYQASAMAVIVFVFFLIWAELAVGIFGTPFAGS